jgi:hypothetical protein
MAMPGSCNDINVFQRSLLLTKLVNGKTPPVEFVANTHTYKMGYYLPDVIYPKWAIFVKPFHALQGKKEL